MRSVLVAEKNLTYFMWSSPSWHSIFLHEKVVKYLENVTFHWGQIIYTQSQLLMQHQCPKRTFAFKEKAFPFYFLLSLFLCLFGPDHHTLDCKTPDSTIFHNILPARSFLSPTPRFSVSSLQTDDIPEKNCLNVFRLMVKNATVGLEPSKAIYLQPI